MHKNKLRVCMPNSLYCFMFYLFVSTEEQIENTLYFFTKDIPKDIRDHMRHSYFIDTKKWFICNRLASVLLGYFIRNAKYPKLKKADIFGLDFNWWLLRGLKMNYIEDCPNVLDIWETSSLYQNYVDFENSSWIKRKLAILLFGEYYRHPVGTSKSVTTIYTSVPYNKPYHAGKRNVFINLKEAWESFTESKRKHILEIFNVDEECLKQLGSRRVILLTQPYAADGHMTEEEQVETYRMIAGSYGAENVIIKPHPRDKCDYKTNLPQVMTFDKIVPMQFLVLLGASFERIATINSSSALSFDAHVPVDWWAEKMDKNVVKDEGFLTLADARKALEMHKG